MNDSIYPKSKPWHLVNIWNDDIDNEVKKSHPIIPIAILNIMIYNLTL
jgi:hypothetical protein